MVVMDNTEKGKDTAEIAEASLASPGTGQETPKEQDEPQYLTLAQAKEVAKQAAKDAVQFYTMQAGRSDKAVRDREEAVARLEKETDERIRESLKEEPDKLSAYDMKKRNKEERDILSQRAREVNEGLIQIAAERAGMEYEDLFELSGGNPDVAKKLAVRLATKPKEKTDTETGTKTEEAPSPQKRMVSVSGKTAGSTKGLTVEQVRGMSHEEQNRRFEEIAKLPLGGFNIPTDKDYR